MDKLGNSLPILMNVAPLFMHLPPKIHCFFCWKKEFSFSANILAGGKAGKRSLKFFKAEYRMIDVISNSNDLF